jgi:hypothetical protein
VSSDIGPQDGAYQRDRANIVCTVVCGGVNPFNSLGDKKIFGPRYGHASALVHIRWRGSATEVWKVIMCCVHYANLKS